MGITGKNVYLNPLGFVLKNVTPPPPRLRVFTILHSLKVVIEISVFFFFMHLSSSKTAPVQNS